MKVYLIGKKVDGFGNDEFFYTDKAYTTEELARKEAYKIINDCYVEKLENLKEDIERRIENAKQGIRSSYLSKEYEPSWADLHGQLITLDDMNMLYELDIGKYFIIEIEVAEK